jgi:unsaturated rhamnogalacturonyl hydrolase
LDIVAYLPAVQNAWTWLRDKALCSDGTVGYVQGPSSHPSQYPPISPTATSNYGTGTFVMAGVESVKLTCSP